MELNFLTISEAVTGLRKKTFSCVELVSACLDRIEKTDNKIHAFITVNKNALNEAREMDKEIASGDDIWKTKPLFGIPVAVKDNFNTLGLPTTAASNVLRNYISPYDSTVSQKLKSAGAIIIGKTNLDSFAHGSSTETSDFGPTFNPWDTNYLPGGSSGGSAAAISADQPIGAVGSETAGSIRQPAAWCGVVGLKPTYGRVSRYGLIAMASSLDSPGPIGKTVADTQEIYKVIAGYDPADATSSRQPLEGTAKQIKNLRIGLPNEYFRDEAQRGVNDAVKKAAAELEKLGAKLVEMSIFDPEYAISVYTILQRSEVSSNLARFDGIRFGHERNSFNAENRRRIMLGTYTLSSGYYDAYYLKALRVRSLIVADFQRAFENVDVILGPTSPTTALKRGASEGQSLFGETADMLVEPSSIAGLPGINIPCGFINNLPVGMQLIGPEWSENQIIDTAKEYERVTEWHERKPKL